MNTTLDRGTDRWVRNRSPLRVSIDHGVSRHDHWFKRRRATPSEKQSSSARAPTIQPRESAERHQEYRITARPTDTTPDAIRDSHQHVTTRASSGVHGSSASAELSARLSIPTFNMSQVNYFDDMTRRRSGPWRSLSPLTPTDSPSCSSIVDQPTHRALGTLFRTALWRHATAALFVVFPFGLGARGTMLLRSAVCLAGPELALIQEIVDQACHISRVHPAAACDTPTTRSVNDFGTLSSWN